MKAKNAFYPGASYAGPAGHAGVATGRGVFSLRSLNLSKRPPLFPSPTKHPHQDTEFSPVFVWRRRRRA
ncbi:hypothetical protein FZD51_22815 [Bacillus infantis]|uniref:Uncharacterized protein n=1 Tax=Bacillus infantis TaxID=324767 RepID=A0A5D4QYH8_9BACI|nr:hypothetical protein FZD51_22815 [Bacillus infantis]